MYEDERRSLLASLLHTKLLVQLRRENVPVDVLEMLVAGNPKVRVRPWGLLRALEEALKAQEKEWLPPVLPSSDSLLAILPPHAAGLSLHHNDHLCCYVTAEQHIADVEEMQHGECDFVSPEDRATAFATNELWELHWYPLTPVGACTVYAATLEALIEWMTRQAAAGWQGGI